MGLNNLKEYGTQNKSARYGSVQNIFPRQDPAGALLLVSTDILMKFCLLTTRTASQKPGYHLKEQQHPFFADPYRCMSSLPGLGRDVGIFFLSVRSAHVVKSHLDLLKQECSQIFHVNVRLSLLNQ